MTESATSNRLNEDLKEGPNLNKSETVKKRKHEDLEVNDEIIEGEDSKEDLNLEDISTNLSISLQDIGSIKDIKELSMKVNKYIKLILSQWESSDFYPKELLIDTKKSLFTVLVKLRKGILDSEQFTSLLTIFYYVQRKNYMKANESYMKLSIGNVAWPIGVINVSIHKRSGQVKLNKGGANIMIDEPTRRWITAVKRLITFKESLFLEKEKRSLNASLFHDPIQKKK